MKFIVSNFVQITRRLSRPCIVVLAAIQISLTLIHFAAAENPSLRHEQLPDDLRKYVDDIRQHCKENDEGSQPKDPMQGIAVIDLDGDGSKDLMVDAERLCTTWIPGGNCSNRGCDLKIWKQTGRRAWRPVFDEHVSRKFVSVDEKDALKLIAVSIWAGSPHCEPVAGKTYMSAESCDAIARYKKGKWTWMKIR